MFITAKSWKQLKYSLVGKWVSNLWKEHYKKMSSSDDKERGVDIHNCFGGPESKLNEAKAPKSYRGHVCMSGMIF